MRIGFDARAISYRGIGTYSRNLLRHFADAGVEVVVFCQDQEKDTMPAVDSFTLVSANMDPLSRLRNLEANVVGMGAAEAQEVEALFARIVAAADELSWHKWRQRPLMRRVAGAILWRLRGLA